MAGTSVQILRSRMAEVLRGGMAKRGAKEIGIAGVASQGALQSASVLAKLFGKQGKSVHTDLYVMGIRTGGPTLAGLRVANGEVSTSAVQDPEDMIILDEALYMIAEDRARLMFDDFCSGILVVQTPEAPDKVKFPWDFKGMVATAPAKQIALEVLQRDPPRFGIALLGAYARTGAIPLDLLLDTVYEHAIEKWSTKIADQNIKAVERTYNETQVMENAVLEARQERLRIEAPKWEDVGTFSGGTGSTPLFELPGISRGNYYAWREELPVWDAKDCLCGPTCILEALCPDGVIWYEGRTFINEEGKKGYEKKFWVDLEFCKGCGVCVEECLHQTMEMKPAAEVYGI